MKRTERKEGGTGEEMSIKEIMERKGKARKLKNKKGKEINRKKRQEKETVRGKETEKQEMSQEGRRRDDTAG